jgi:hypothetical protein
MHATSYIMTWRSAGDPARRGNLNTVLQWLGLVRPAEVIVVEQDVAPTLTGLPAVPGLRYVFAYNPGPFNKSWGFNVGVRYSSGSVLAFADADVVCGSFPVAVARCRAGAPVVRAFRGIHDLDEAQSELVCEDLSCLSDPGFLQRPPDRAAAGEVPPVCGALVLFRREFYMLLGGWDERFLGWGGEDNAMDIKVARAQIQPLVMNVADGVHLHHERANADIARSPHYRNNLALLDQLRSMSDEALRRFCEVSMQLAGNPEMHRPMEKLP